MPKRKRVVKRKVKQVNKSKRTSYTINQKIEVVTFAKENGKNNAAKYFNVSRSMVGRWILASSNWTTETKGTSKRIGSGRKAFFPEAEKRLYDWVVQQRKQGLAVSYAILRSKMLEILQEVDMLELYGDLAEEFKTSHRWLVGFLRRYKLALRRRTRISQKLPSKTQELLENFHKFIIHLRLEKSYELENILNMDETPVWFDMAGNFTINPKGEKTVHIRATGNEKNQFTVVLTCAAGKHFLRFFFKKIIMSDSTKIV